MSRRYKLYYGRSKHYKRYRHYRGHSRYNGPFHYGLYKTNIAVLNDYADQKDRKGFLTYVNKRKKPRRLFNLWKAQRQYYLDQKIMDEIDDAWSCY